MATKIKYPDEYVIRVLVDDNPKRPGSRSHGEFALYKTGMTVSEYLAAGGSRAGINWDAERGFIAVEQPAAEKAKARKAKAKAKDETASASASAEEQAQEAAAAS